jgi:hypothetical protein
MLERLPTANARLRQEKMQRRDENQRLQEQGEQVSIQMHDLERTYEQETSSSIREAAHKREYPVIGTP